MAMTDEQRREAAAALLHAENTREWIDPITDTYPGAYNEDAYAIGQYVTDAKVAAGYFTDGSVPSTGELAETKGRPLL